MTHMHTPAAHLITAWPWSLIVWPQNQYMLSDCHAVRCLPSLVLMAQILFILECEHTDIQSHMPLITLPTHQLLPASIMIV